MREYYKPLLFIWICLTIAQTGYAEIRITDLAGRHVTLDEPVERFVISEGKYITTLALLNPDNPVQGLVGMMSTLGWSHPRLEEQLFEQFPEAKSIPLFGSREANSVSVEKIIDLDPQVAIFGIQDHGPSAKNKELVDLLSAAGIKIVFIDFRIDPMRNTQPSIDILGKVLGRQSQAVAYLDYYRSRVERIRERVSVVKHKPTVFLQAHVGRFPCCVAMADGMLGPFVEQAGGVNIADKVAPGPTSRHTAEFLLVEDPDVWIGTASGNINDFNLGKKVLALGPGMNQAMAQESLVENLNNPEFQAMSAINNRRAHSIWHNFYNSPMNIVAMEAFARWIHPETFADVDPQRSMQEIYDRFLPFELNGVYSATLEEQ